MVRLVPPIFLPHTELHDSRDAKQDEGENGSQKPIESPLQAIERKAMRKLTMETSLEDNFLKCHPQDQSPIYSVLPKEIRDMIFLFATTTSEDLEKPYNDDERYYRPGYRGPHRTPTNLLLTCRRIWLETNALPMRQFTPTFWYGEGPRENPDIHPSYSWTRLNRQNALSVQLFLQLCNAEDMAAHPDRLYYFLGCLKPRELKITIRHSDWWFWESYDRLVFHNDRWVQGMLNAANVYGIEQVTLELEVLDSERPQLELIVNKIRQTESSPIPRLSQPSSTGDPSGSQSRFTEVRLTTTKGPCAWQWVGSSKLQGNGPGPQGEPFSRPHKDLPELKYHVEVITWHSTSKEVENPDPSLDKPSSCRHGTSASPAHLFTMPQQTPAPNPLIAPRDIFNRRRLFGRRGPMVLPSFMKNSDRREMMQQDGWPEFPFPESEDNLRHSSMAAAKKTEDERRDVFNKAIAVIVVRDVGKKFQEQNSLLKFED